MNGYAESSKQVKCISPCRRSFLLVLALNIDMAIVNIEGRAVVNVGDFSPNYLVVPLRRCKNNDTGKKNWKFMRMNKSKNKLNNRDFNLEGRPSLCSFVL